MENTCWRAYQMFVEMSVCVGSRRNLNCYMAKWPVYSLCLHFSGLKSYLFSDDRRNFDMGNKERGKKFFPNHYSLALISGQSPFLQLISLCNVTWCANQVLSLKCLSARKVNFHVAELLGLENYLLMLRNFQIYRRRKRKKEEEEEEEEMGPKHCALAFISCQYVFDEDW